MPAKPVSERAPVGLDARWKRVWEQAVKVLKARETWRPEHRELLDEYVFALVEAEGHRKAAKRAPFTESENGRTYIHPGFAAQDAAVRRAAGLARTLRLTPDEAKAAPGVKSKDPFVGLDPTDEVAVRRSRRRVVAGE